MSILDKYTYHICNSYKELQKMLSLVEDSVVGVDTETTSLKYATQEIESVQIAGNNNVVFIPTIVWLENSKVIGIITKFLQDKLFVAHNAPFDLAALHKIGVYFEGEVFCTQTAAHLINETYPKGLKDIAANVFKIKAVKYNDVKHLLRNSKEFIKYSCNDAIFCRELYPMMKSSLEKNKQWPLASRIEMPFQHVLKDMRINGIGADSAKAKELSEKAAQLAYKLNIECHEAAGLRFMEQCDLFGNQFISSKWNLGSTQQLIDIIENKLGLEITETTDKGNKSVGKKTKERLKNQCVFVKKLDIYGKAIKLLNGFLSPFDSFVDKDGRMRSDWNNTGTVTGRPSSSDPDLLNLPKDNEEIDINFRECFVAPEGKILIAGDFCFSEDTEFLTQSGFKLYKNISSTDLVAQYKSGEITYARPLNYINRPYVGKMIHIKGNYHADLLMTENHLCLLTRRGKDYWVLSQDYMNINSYQQLNAGVLKGETQENPDKLRLIAAIQADANNRKNEYVFWLKKDRKIERLKELLNKLNMPFKVWVCKSKVARYGIQIYKEKWMQEYLDDTKTFIRKSFLNLTPECRVQFIKELHFWDGNYSGYNYTSTNIDNCNIVQEIALLSGIRSNLTVTTPIKKDGIKRKSIGVVYFSNKDRTYIKTFTKTDMQYSGNVVCFTMPNGTVITRRNGRVCITGNCGQELRVLADISKDAKLIEAFTNGYDMHLTVANEIFKLGIPKEALSEKHPDYAGYREKHKVKRHQAKNKIVFPLIYGSTAKGISEGMRISIDEAQMHIDNFFKSFPAVKRLIDATRGHIEKTGYAVNKSGRRRHFSKEYGKYNNGCMRQGFNFLIQGTSADMTKICCVNIRRESRKHPEWEAVILMEIYDEILIECKEEFKDKVIELMLDSMRNSYRLSVPLDIVVGYGKNYQMCK